LSIPAKKAAKADATNIEQREGTARKPFSQEEWGKKRRHPKNRKFPVVGWHRTGWEGKPRNQVHEKDNGDHVSRPKKGGGNQNTRAVPQLKKKSRERIR